jgi:hypothetical protein
MTVFQGAGFPASVQRHSHARDVTGRTRQLIATSRKIGNVGHSMTIFQR